MPESIVVFKLKTFNRFRIILPQNKDIEVDSVEKFHSILSVLQNFVNIRIRNLAVAFSRKYTWPKHYFSEAATGGVL